MCIAAPGKVTKLSKNLATVSYPDGQQRIAKVLGEKVSVGSFVLVQMGFIIDILSKAEVQSAWQVWQEK